VIESHILFPKIDSIFFNFNFLKFLYKMHKDDIIGLKFSMMSDDHIVSVNNNIISVPDTGNNKDALNSIASGALGSVHEQYTCPTCGFTKSECTGHSGYINLGTPICNPFFIENIVKYLNIVCFECGGIVIPVGKGTTFSKICTAVTAKKKKMKLLCENVIDYKDGNPVYCGARHPNVYENKKDARSVIVKELYDIDVSTKKKIIESSGILPPYIIESCFQKITPQTLKILEITDPELAPINMVNRMFYVPPNSVRPNAYSANMSKVPKNDFNVQLNSILKESQKLGDSSLQMDEKKNINIMKELQKMAYNLQRGSATGSEKPLNSYQMALSKKQGFIRGATLGGRVFRVGRDFITGNPRAKLNEIHIPLQMAVKIPIEVRVTSRNIGELTRYLANGDKVYPRCHGVRKGKTGATFLAAYAKNIVLEEGDVLTRDMVTGDYSAFCRQPTLQLSNITVYRVIVSEHNTTFSFNPNILPAFAGDFDGDEINMYVSAEEGGTFEGRLKASIDEMLISNSYGMPLIGQIQDGVLGLAMLTRDSVQLNLNSACRLFDNTGLRPNILKLVKNGLITGRSVLTALFEVLGLKINYTGKSKYFANGELNPYRTYSATEINVIIRNGVFESGIIDAKTVGNKTNNNLYHSIYNKYGAKSMRDAIWYMQRLAINYIGIAGFTMHINDFRIREAEHKKIQEYELSIVSRSMAYTKNLYRGNIVASSNKTVSEHYESEQIKILQETQTYNKHIHDGMDYEGNNLYFSVYTGTKGSARNIVDGIISGGQQILDSKRLQTELAGRVSHFYPRFSDDPRARGFILNSYATGYTPSDMFSASFVHRRGIVSKALSTAESGKKYRDGTSSLDSHILNNLRQVVKGPKMRQLLYGGDGMDPRATYLTVTKLIFLTEAELRQRATGAELKLLLEDRDFCRDIFITQQHRTGEEVGRIGYIPVNIPLILTDIVNIPVTKADSGAHQKLAKFIEDIPYLYFHRSYRGPIPAYFKENCRLFQAYLRWELRSEIVSAWSTKQVETFIYLATSDFINNMEDPGTAVGIRGIQATGEIGTQNILDSIHSNAGPKIASYKNIMDAVGVLKMEGAAMEIHFQPHITDEEIVDFAKKIEMLHLEYFISKYQIFYEKHDQIVHPKYVHENKMVSKNAELIEFPRDILNWCIRLEFNIARIVVKNISLEDIYMKISHHFSFLHVIFNTVNTENPVMRVYIKQAALHKYNLQNAAKVNLLVEDLLKLIVRGIDRIKMATVYQKDLATVEGDKITKHTVKIVRTEGTNLAKILTFPEVNPYFTKSNSVHEMQEIYGICGAYTAVLDGLRLSIEGAYNTHYTVLANEMCSKWFYSAINRNGSAKRDSSVCQLIADGSFMSVLKNATLKGKIDYNTGINSSMIIGTTPKVGTNYVNIIYNEDFIEKEGDKNLRELEDL
jgi:DNA-directed RNA polymerase beta' subunit